MMTYKGLAYIYKNYHCTKAENLL